MTKLSVQRKVRKRDRFMCCYCSRRGEQYAHIVPDSDGGEYKLNNLIFLCYEHHQQLESAQASKEMKEKLRAIGERLRDQPKNDDFLRYIFAWPAGKEIVVILGGGIKFINQERILESKNPDQPYLRLRIDELGTLSIDAYFEDSSGNNFLRINDNDLEVHTSQALDVVISRRSIRFEHIDKKVYFQIRQAKNMDLHVSGSLYLNGGNFLITETEMRDVEHNNIISNCIMESNARGLFVAPGSVMM